MAKEYKGLIGNAAKEAFRSRWAAAKLKEAESKLQMLKSECHQQEHSTTGTYLPFKRVWDMEGSDKDGYLAF
jgi:hypothetical protein